MEEDFPWVQNVLLFGFSTPMHTGPFLAANSYPLLPLFTLRSVSLPLPCSWCFTSQHILPEIFQPAARCGWGSSGCILVTQRTSDRRGLAAASGELLLLSQGQVCCQGKGHPEGCRKQNTTKACLYSQVFLFHLFMGKENNRKERMWKIWSPTGEKKRLRLVGKGRERKHAMGRAKDGSANQITGASG